MNFIFGALLMLKYCEIQPILQRLFHLIHSSYIYLSFVQFRPKLGQIFKHWLSFQEQQYGWPTTVRYTGSPNISAE